MLAHGILSQAQYPVVTAAGPSWVTDSLEQYIDPFASTITSTTATDLSGNGNTATVNASMVAGANGWVLDLEGNIESTGKYLNLGFSTQTWNDFTWEIWFRVNTPNSSENCNFMAFYNQYDVVQLKPVTSTSSTSEGNAFYRGFAGDFGITTSGVNLNDGDWHHVVLVTSCTANTQTYYVDGTAYASGTTSITATAASPAAPVYAGGPNGVAAGTGNRFFRCWGDANMGLTRIYTKALDSSEVSQNYNANKADYGL